MRALAITGPRSSLRQVQPFLDAGKAAGVSFEVLHAPDLALARERLAATLPDTVLLFGGDGTLHRHLPALAGQSFPLLMVPTGSGNDFAMSQGIATLRDALEVWRRWLQGEARVTAADLGAARFQMGEERLFSCCLNIGLDADAAARTNRLPDWIKERGGYFLGGVGAILGYHPGRIRFESAEMGFDGPLWLVSASNTPTYGGGMKIAPQASLQDGRLDVTVLHSCSRLKLFGLFPRITNGSHVRHGCVSVFSTQALGIVTPDPAPVYADGECIGETPVQIRVLPGALQVLGHRFR